MEKFQKWAFYGWISEEDRPLQGGDKFLYSENINVTSDPKVIELSNKLVLDITPAEKPLQMHTVVTNDASKTSKTLVMCEWGKVYQVWNATAVYDNSSLGSFAYPCFTVAGKFFFINGTGATSEFELNFVTLDDAVSTSWSPTLAIKTLSPTLANQTLSDNNYFTNFTVVVVWQRVFIGLWDKIELFKVDTNTVTTYDWVWEEIVGLSYGWGLIKIITESGKLHLWDGNSESPVETTDLEMKIQNTYEIGGIIYLVTGFKWQDRGLYYLNWYVPERIVEKRFSREAGIWKFDFRQGIQTITNDRRNLYFVDEHNGDYRVAFFGKKSQELPNAYVYENVFVSTWARPFGINCIHYASWNLYVWWTDNWAHGIDKIGTTKNITGYIETNPEDFDTWIYRKWAKHIKMRVADIDAEHTVVIKESRDGGAYTTLVTQTTQPLDNVIRIPLNWDFRESKLRFELTSDDSVSPKIYYWYEYAYEIKDI